MQKILIAVPTYENIYPDTFKSIYDLDGVGNELSFESIRGYDVATARNKIVRKADELGVDYVLMVDNDVVIPGDALKNLLEDNERVCIGFYAHRGTDNLYHGNTNICRIYDTNGIAYFNYPLESEYTGKELAEMKAEGRYKVQIHGGGLGCALIRMDVFEIIKYPWFGWSHYKSGKMLSEDLYFCERCKDKKIKIFTDTRVNCGHLMRHVQFAD